ncbi:bifunctional protein tyrosine phosphatase family protein/NAD(P)/FAD-dependent oxidoreductase [Brucella thiophenivorans]|uniref:Lycopene cyclase family protein n=1 Tax=Brucella thiophenivorans TaxID=571255 RepID=A0A256G8B7_9HYPH|nr:bifunctional protein tyrosine phosphatase family protein/NAD(P)/FAD-dependent oxidoreductase [Brucella thiophenivorans]OYR23314.1 lycopene cyclase family protein [Brucella thiophenivorans]
MDIRKIDDRMSVSPQIGIEDVGELVRLGFKSIISTRPDGEEALQPDADSIASVAKAAGLEVRHIPVLTSEIRDRDVALFDEAMRDLPKPVLAFCRSGTRAASLWALSQAHREGSDAVLGAAKAAGYDLQKLRLRLESRIIANDPKVASACDVLIVGAGAAGIATAASLLKRRHGLNIIIADPAERHAYQPGWTMVGGGIFKPEDTVRSMAAVMPAHVTWVKTAVAEFDPDHNCVRLSNGRRIDYRILVAAPGIKLDWAAIEGLEETLGRNGVTSNYRYDTAPYTWSLVKNLQGGKALFTQPPMPIKCAGAPQKALYLSGDHWFRSGRINDISIEFHNAGPVLFGVKDYVPVLMEYIKKYRADLQFGSRLVAVAGSKKEARFARVGADGSVVEETRGFDILHVCPPQTAPDFVRASPLANQTGWIDVDETSLQHKRYSNVFSLGDAAGTTNAKTAAAARKQAPIVAENVLATLDGRNLRAAYDGYGSCPLTVERGKIVLAEFGYGGKLLPTFPSWVIDGTKPSSLAWYLKSEALPRIYWHGMLKGREWLASPDIKEKVS